MLRIIPVLDDEDEAKCSFDARGDQRSGIFRKTMCVEANTIQDTLYTDSRCEEEADRETVPIVRGECMPLPKQGQAMERRPGPQGQGGRPNQGGGKGGRGEGGRRRAEYDEDGAPKAPKCDGDFNQGWTWETLKDLWDELTCDSGEDDEGEDASEESEDRPQNPCRFLSRNDCAKNDACDMQQNICVWNEAPDNRRNLYVTYDWKYLVEDGEQSDETFCYSDDLIFSTYAEYKVFCEAAETEDECVPMGCKSFKEKKKTPCTPQKSKVKCKKLGKGAGKDFDLKSACNMYSLAGCEWKEGKNGKDGKCVGDVKLKDLDN